MAVRGKWLWSALARERRGGDRRRAFQLRRDRGAFGQPSEPPSEILVPAQIDASAPLRPDDPGDVRDVGQAEPGAGKVRALGEGRVQFRELGIEGLGRLPFEDDTIVGAGKLIEALEPKPNERACGRPMREKGGSGWRSSRYSIITRDSGRTKPPSSRTGTLPTGFFS